MPEIKSAIARFTTNQLNGIRKFLFGSRTRAKMMRMLPETLMKDQQDGYAGCYEG